ncbi:uncharacterized protein LOC110033477 [Phalaenopsis equestris]|uniref:uncharacterized protein LOC110033477 n=1 Tax=Phalaenopsis equestris TaxID=78828 RepID=UPI0009E25359|nr:uncharacterized protein LOC110033477 [Phalaenopsis equestris]
MPRGHGRTVFVPDYVADRRSSVLSRRSSEQYRRKLSSKENAVIVPVLSNCEERPAVLRFLRLDVHLSQMMVPFSTFIQGPELRNEQGSQNPVNADILDNHNSSFPQPRLFIQFDLQKETCPGLQKNPKFTVGSAQMLPTAAQEESSWLNYGSNCISLNASADATRKADKPAKQSSRKKGKKKRKHYKRSSNKKAFVKPENPGEEVNCDASKSKISTGGDLVCSAASENMNLLVQDASNEALEQIECNGIDRSCLLSSFMGKPLDESVDGLRKTVSLSYEFSDNVGDKMSFEILTSSSNQSCELSSSTSLQNNAEIYMTEDSLYDCGMEWSNSNNGGFNLENRTNFNSSDWQKDIADTDCSSERLLGSSQASSSDDFHPVIRAKRGRAARKFSGFSNDAHQLNNVYLHRRSETINKHSVWQKVEKAGISDLTCPQNNEKTASRNIDIAFNCLETSVRRGKPFRCSNEMDSPQSYSSIVSSMVKTTSDSINIPSKIQALRNENFENAVDFKSISQSQLTLGTNALSRSTKNSKNSILQNTSAPDNICSVLQNTSPVSRKIQANSTVIESNPDQSRADQYPSSLNSSFTDEFSSNSRSLAHLSTREIQCLSPSSTSTDCSSPEEGSLINKLYSQPCTSSEGSSDFPSPSGSHFSLETKRKLFLGFETGLMKIIEAVNGSYEYFVTTESIQLAGFERLLRSASPLIETGCISTCGLCSQSRINGDSLCSHQVPNESLRRLWKWYEKPGSYGLEVKLDDSYSLKRSRTNLSKFCAYFVPYLSAVQLFGRSGKVFSYPKEDAEGDVMKSCDVCERLKCSTGLASLPILSKLLPRPCKKEDKRSTKLCSSRKDEEFDKLNFEEQLLFEYFDSDQPQQRRPLFDKIQELILGDSSANCHFFGDPSKLASINLNELHPASWYAVAWYPIYQIPEGSFRAAFLTYHSFGRFVRKNTSNTVDGCINSITLPVVGLQSYNAQNEFWFEPTNLNSGPTIPSENLKSRLQSLEKTASVMSTASIRKNNLNCTNRHPDYEFFLSRKR